MWCVGAIAGGFYVADSNSSATAALDFCRSIMGWSSAILSLA